MKAAIREILETILLTAVIFLLVHSAVQNFRVEGSSMEPNLHEGQYLLVNKLAYVRIDLGFLRFIPFLESYSNQTIEPFGPPRPGDIIVFRFPRDPEKDFIKRVIAGPGDTVEIRKGKVWVNGKIIEEPYVMDRPGYTLPRQTVPPRNFFVLGDNRNNSSDSHIWGVVPRENILGKAWVIYWPARSWGLVANYALAVGTK
jgi:signal peptidase I